MIHLPIIAGCVLYAIYERSERIDEASRYKRDLEKKKAKLRKLRDEHTELADQVKCMTQPRGDA